MGIIKNTLLLVAVSLLSSIATVVVYDNYFTDQSITNRTPRKASSHTKQDMPRARYATLPGDVNQSPSRPITSLAAPQSPASNDLSDVAEAVTPTVVHIKGAGGDDFWSSLEQSSGSGVIINENGYILTNNHVVEDANRLEVTLNDGRRYNADLVGTDPSTDLAVIRIAEKDLAGRKLSYLTFGNSNNLRVGQWVLAVGNPFNLTSTVTAGIVSAKGRNIDILEGTYSIESFIQTDAAVNPGNSGGALVNEEGKLVGINTAILTRSGRYEGYSFAVPSNLARKVMRDIVEFGEVQRGFLGVVIENLDEEIADEKGLESLNGTFIREVKSGSAADDAGLLSGDIIVAINNVSVKGSPELQEQVALFRPGEKIKVNFIRGGTPMETDIILRNRDNTTELSQPRKARFNSKDNVLNDLGMRVRRLSEDEQSNFDTEGVIITDVTDGSIIAGTNLEEGFIVERVNGNAVSNERELIELIYSATGEVKLQGFYEKYDGEYNYVFEK